MKRNTAAARKRGKRKVATNPRGLGRGDGCVVKVHVAERFGGVKDAAERAMCFPATGSSSKKRLPSTSRVSRPPRQLSEATTEAFAALGHPQRAQMLLALLGGPATYRAIQKLTKLKAGPLYHHVNHLRLAGLIAPRQRDLYELTRGGRNLALLAIAAAPLIRDARRRLLK